MKWAVLFLIAAMPAMALASEADGLWATEKNENGGYLEVKVAPCASNASLTCGIISRAFNAKGEDSGYVNLGKSIIENMKHDGNGTYSGGTIWDPENNKTYSSKMILKGDVLDVEGCVAIFCRGQNWKRVNR